MMDEVKDYDKDVIVHPDRPLPRGILKKQEVEFVIRVIVLALSLYSVLVGMAFGWSAGLWFAAEVLYSVLMYLEFGIGDTLDETPFFNAVLHQASIYVSAFFLSAAAGINEPYMHGKSWHVGHLGLSAFFTFEICRKLDPDLPKIKGTYLVVYGKWKTLLMTVGTIAFGAYGSWSLGLSHVLLPIEIGFLALLAVHFVVPYGKGSVQKRHKLLEGLAFLYLLFHLWGPVFIPKL
jgi:4-hydroxybenzoate polyprenyltransferase